MASQPCPDDSASSNCHDQRFGPSPLSLSIAKPPFYLSIAKPSFEAGQRSPPAQHRSPPVVRIIRICSPKFITTDAADFRALVQKMTGNSSGPSDPDGDTASNPLKKNGRQEKRRKRADAKVPRAAGEVTASTSAGRRSIPTQTQYDALASNLSTEGDMNSAGSPSVESGISWENSESVDHLAFREVNVQLPLFPPPTYLCDQGDSFFEDQCWRLTDADDLIPT